MNKLTYGLAAAIASVSMLLSGSARAQDFSGQWGCQYGYAEYTAQGYLRGHSREFYALLHANGVFEASGQMSSGAGIEAFQAQGNWRYSPQSNEIEAQGQSLQQSGIQMPFAFGGIVISNGRGFQSNIEMPDSTGRYVAQRLSVVCQR